MKGCYGIVNGKDVFIDKKLIEKTIANGVAKGFVKGTCEIYAACLAGFGALCAWAYVYKMMEDRKKSEPETETEKTEDSGTYPWL